MLGRSRRRSVAVCALALTACLCAPIVAHGQAFPIMYGYGPRAGFTIDPDQIHIGIMLHLGYVAPAVSIRPVFDLGLGDDVTLFEFNFDGIYQFDDVINGPWVPYAGGSLGINHSRVDLGPLGDHSDTDFGLSLLGGMQRPWTGYGDLLFELRIGLIDAPDAKITAGVMFR